jgi:hypothetical protein
MSEVWKDISCGLPALAFESPRLAQVEHVLGRGKGEFIRRSTDEGTDMRPASSYLI